MPNLRHPNAPPNDPMRCCSNTDKTTRPHAAECSEKNAPTLNEPTPNQMRRCPHAKWTNEINRQSTPPPPSLQHKRPHTKLTRSQTPPRKINQVISAYILQSMLQMLLRQIRQVVRQNCQIWIEEIPIHAAPMLTNQHIPMPPSVRRKRPHAKWTYVIIPNAHTKTRSSKS